MFGGVGSSGGGCCGFLPCDCLVQTCDIAVKIDYSYLIQFYLMGSEI